MITGMFKRLVRKLKPVAVACTVIGLIAFSAWGTVFVNGAIAMPNQAADVEMSRAKSELDNKVGAGTSNRIEGRAQEGVGAVKRSLGKATGQVEGATDQLQGKVKRDVGRAQRAADKAGDQLEDSSEGFVESIKDFFGQ